MKYYIEDPFWSEEEKDWDGILEEFYTLATGKQFRNTIVPQNIKNLTLRVKYWYGGKIYKAISKDISFRPGENESEGMKFSIPLSSVWIVDHDDKPQVNITEKVKRYAGPRNDFHGQSVPLREFLYYTTKTLRTKYPKIILGNSLGMKKMVINLEDSTTDLCIP
tara:strand:- start:1872 stop:2363 length:492 start_codon:yes stop_codon:yes gene_type:complete